MKQQEPYTKEQGMNYALRLLSQRNYSTATLRQKLHFKKVEQIDIDAIINRLVDLELLNDERYAASFIRTESAYKHTSSRFITQKLRQKGIAPTIIATKIEEASDTSELERATYHARRYVEKHPGSTSHEGRQKLAGYLYRRGFPTNIIYKAIESVTPKSP